VNTHAFAGRNRRQFNRHRLDDCRERHEKASFRRTCRRHFRFGFSNGDRFVIHAIAGLDKSDMAESEPLSASSTIGEQVAEAQKIRQEQYRADELVNTLTLINSSEASLAVKQLAQEEWPDNRRLQDDFSEKQMTALSELSAMEIDAPHKETLLNNAIQEIVPSFRNMHSEYMDQLAAYEEINNSRLPPLEKRLIEIAKVDYPDNYIVIRHEYRRQLQAYQWIEAQTLDTEAKRLA